jgi:phenylpropionate dioxygenase-like ring-hydroxylating dioxygenase large terminal subunit
VQDDRVHRDVYLSAELFALEQQHFFANTWLYYGHTSQVPNAGDYFAQDDRRQAAGDGAAGRRRRPRALQPLCPQGHAAGDRRSGNTGRFFRCPYHAWTYKLDGAPLAVPIKSGYEGTRLKDCESGRA